MRCEREEKRGRRTRKDKEGEGRGRKFLMKGGKEIRRGIG